MSNIPDAWDDEWSSAADKTPGTNLDVGAGVDTSKKRTSGKVTKAQKRAQQAEFNRQLWAEAEGPRETNYFLESRNVVPLKSEFKPPPVLLSRKGPVIQTRKKENKETGSQTLADATNNLTIKSPESSEDEEEDEQSRLRALADRQAQSAREREERQRKYEERRQELFGTSNPSLPAAGSSNLNVGSNTAVTNTRSGNSSPGSLTPPGSRSSTPNRGRGRGRRGGAHGSTVMGHQHSQSHSRSQQPQRELFDPSYSAKPESSNSSRRGEQARNTATDEIRPVRAPKGPDGSGRGGFGFTSVRGGRTQIEAILNQPPVGAEG